MSSQRIERFEKDKFFENLNMYLEQYEKVIQSQIAPSFKPNIFVMGLPRSGTTLMSQVLFKALDISVTNNVHSKFWKAPVTGALFSDMIVKSENNSGFTSNYGRTNGKDEPHEFSYYWKDRLRMDEFYDLRESQANLIDWSRLRTELGQMNAVTGKSYLFKTMEYSGLYFDEFLKLFPNSVFIFIEREDMEVASSIYRARRSLNIANDQWWGSVPIDIYDLNFSSVEERIAAQVNSLNMMYSRVLSSDSVIKVNYHNFCKDPFSFIEKISIQGNIKITISQKDIVLNSTPGDYRIEQHVKDELEYWFDYYSKLVSENG